MCCRRKDDLFSTNQDPLPQCSPTAEPTSAYRNSRLILNSRYVDFSSLKLCDYLRGILVSRVWSNVGGGARRWEIPSPNDAFKEEGPSRLDELFTYVLCRPEPHLSMTEPMCGFQTPFTPYDLRYSRGTTLSHTQTTSDA